MTDHALELAFAARCTPSLDASDSLDVLVDVLLEQEKIKPSDSRHKRPSDYERAVLRNEAWKWADEATLTLFGKMSRAFDMVGASAPRPSRMVMNPADYQQIRELLGRESGSAPYATSLMSSVSSNSHVPRGVMYSIPRGNLDQDGAPRRASIDDAAAFVLPVGFR